MVFKQLTYKWLDKEPVVSTGEKYLLEIAPPQKLKGP